MEKLIELVESELGELALMYEVTTKECSGLVSYLIYPILTKGKIINFKATIAPDSMEITTVIDGKKWHKIDKKQFISKLLKD